MGIPLKEGRAFTAADRIGSPKVAVVSETLARTFWPNESALGHFLVYDWDGTERVEIVGVVGDVHHDGPDKQAYMEIYRPHSQFAYSSMALVVRVRSGAEPVQFTRSVGAAVRQVDADVPLASVMSLSDLVAQAVASARLSTSLFVLFGGLGLLLATIGIYGVMAYTVQQRQHEIGVRVALGASPRSVIAMMVRRGVSLSFIGIAIGMVLAFSGAGLMQKLLFGVPPHDAATFVAIALILAGVGVLAAYLPARRAARVDPVSALRT
jgi:putative ABC transport system permease protein